MRTEEELRDKMREIKDTKPEGEGLLAVIRSGGKQVGWMEAIMWVLQGGDD